MFNKSQIQAISHMDGPAMVLAGPGSGKTTVITHRIKNLIEKAEVRPENILVVTFTKAAAISMQKRFSTLMNGGKGQLVTFGTFHSVFYKILRKSRRYEATEILSERQKTDYIIFQNCLRTLLMILEILKVICLMLRNMSRPAARKRIL